LDKQWSLIEQQQHQLFDKILLSKVPDYSDYASPTALLTLVYHSGKEHYVPSVAIGSDSGRITNLLSPSFRYSQKTNSLILDMIDLNEVGTDQARYRQCLISFLQDPNISGGHAVGVETYTRITLFFIRQLELLQHLERTNFTFDEDYLSRRLSVHNDIWKLDLADCQRTDSEFHAAVDFFLFLGYIIFFLPLSGKSGPIVEYCRQATLLTEPGKTNFPHRTSLVRQAMKDYLERIVEIKEKPSVGFFSSIFGWSR